MRDGMANGIDPIRAEVEAGEISAQTLVRLYNLAATAAQAGDVATLTAAARLANELARIANSALRADAERLIALCDDLLRRVEMQPRSVAQEQATCPSCGHELSGSPVRCRACGQLLL